MSMMPVSDHAQSTWTNLLSAETAIRESLRAFLVEPSVDRVAVIRNALAKPGSERAAAVRVLPYLSMPERMELFPDLVWLASWAHGYIQAARDAIHQLPKDWVLAHIEDVTEPILASANEQHQFEEYRRLLELFAQVGDQPLLRRLAERARVHHDEDVRKAADEALAKLGLSQTALPALQNRL
jgi:hypothetical protein